jgi:hypothetical protein
MGDMTIADGDTDVSAALKAAAKEHAFDRTANSLLALGEGLALLNGRLDAAEGVMRAIGDAAAEASRNANARLDAAEREIARLENMIVALAKAAGFCPVYNDEVKDGDRPDGATTH